MRTNLEVQLPGLGRLCFRDCGLGVYQALGTEFTDDMVGKYLVFSADEMRGEYRMFG